MALPTNPDKLHRQTSRVAGSLVELVVDSPSETRLVVSAGDVLINGQKRRLEDDEYFDLAASPFPQYLSVYLVEETSSRLLRILFDCYAADGQESPYIFGADSPYALIHQVLTASIPPKTALVADCTMMIRSVSKG
jgi:hypothetical protein